MAATTARRWETRTATGPSPSGAGDDCDDNDARRFPGATEICDAENLDEDCDGSTIGEMGGDRDGDGYVHALLQWRSVR
ncbi:MAG: putative metal-binding motif-containing protein [Sandaracinaceae bacterium]